MSKPAEVNSFLLANTIADLRAKTPRQGANTVAILLGATSGKVDSKGGMFVFDPTNTQADNGTTVIKVAGVTGSWVKINRSQDPINLEQFGALASGAFNKFVGRGGNYSTVKSFLGTAGSSTTTVAIAVNGVLAVTLTFVAAATTATVAYASGTSITVNDGDRVTFTVTAGTAAQNLALSLDF